MFGDLFPTLHVAAVIMHAVLVIIVFYRFPRLAYFPDVHTKFLHPADVMAYRALKEGDCDYEQEEDSTYKIVSNMLSADNIEILIRTDTESL